MTATNNNVAETLPDIHDIKPPIEIASGTAWIWWIVLMVAIAVAAFLLSYWLKRRKLNVVLPPPVPPHIRAKKKLKEALALITQPKPFVVAVSDTARSYLEERFNFRAPERTTEEFLRELAGTKLLLPDQKDSLGNFLESCDLVKFAKYEPGEKELMDLHGSALRLIEETEPQPQPGTNAGSAAQALEPEELANRKS
jgi:hypothetical protein